MGDWNGHDHSKVWPIRRISMLYSKVKSVEVALLGMAGMEHSNTDQEDKSLNLNAVNPCRFSCLCRIKRKQFDTRVGM